jgi:hypothetical protein
MATAEAIQRPEKVTVGPVAALPSSAPTPVERRTECRPYGPDQFVIVLLAGCALLVLAMNLYDVISGIFGW